jgi:serine protease Do
MSSARRPARDWNLRQTPIVEAVRRVRDAVVNIHSERTVQGPASEELFTLSPSQNRINGMGTGIIIDPRGFIITNHHVVEDVNVIRARLSDGTVASARVLARDQESDLALLKIDVNRPLATVPLGTASDLMVGETCIAIGNAYGYEHTVTVGVVSATGRDVTLNKEVSYKSLIQTDASINPGNSGGPLINIYGELIGVNVAIRAGAQGIGFAIPVETMIRVSGSMLRNRVPGRNGLLVANSGLGLQVRDSLRTGHDDSSPLRTVVVERVEQGSAAAKAGLQRGDVLLKVGDLPLACSMDVERGLLDAAAGEHIPLLTSRNGAEHKSELVLEPIRPAAAANPDLIWRKLGLHLQAISGEEVARNHPQLHGGLSVSDVRPEGAAAKAGIQRGDILVGLHQWEMLNLENVLFVLNHPDLPTFNPLRFYILRGNQVHRGWLQTLD